MNSHVIMCAQAQLSSRSSKSTLKSSKSLELSSSSSSSPPRPLPKRGAKRKRNMCTKPQQENIISHSKIINVASMKRRKRIIDRDENMKLRYESVESLKKDNNAKQAMELILLDYLS